MLHLIFAARLDGAIFERIADGDVLVFMESAVIRLIRGSVSGNQLAKLIAVSPTYVLSDQLAIRGIEASMLVEGVNIIRTSDLVTLCVKHAAIHSWT